MKKAFKFISVAVLGLTVYIVLGASCIPKTSISVDGFLFGRPYQTFVDNGLAKQMLTDPKSDLVTKLFSAYADKPLNTATLSEIAINNSMDVATLYFMQRAYQDKQNKQAQDLYLTYLDQLSDNNFKQQLSPLADFYVAFVPGLDYNDTTNGGNFARQRRLLAASGIQNELILTDDWGLTDDNALTVAKRLIELSKQHEKIIVVSASKGGLETAIALGKVLKPEETKSIKAWISVGGILNGSPVADTYLCWPKCWIAEIGLMTVGQKISLVQDVSYKKRAAEFTDFNFPDNIKRVHFVGAPLATQIHKRIKSNYCSIKKFGPNDGITPLMDEVSQNGIIVSELGLDHYYSSPSIDKKTIALALVVAKIQN
ncbi:MAG: hypothetical protein V4651_12755 [Bacteroidota bacterium]